MTDDVRPLDAEMAHEAQAVGGLAGNGQQAVVAAAARESAPVVADQTEPVVEGRLCRQWCERVGDVAAVDEDHGVARALHFVLQRDPVDLSAVHQSSSFGASVAVAEILALR